MPRFNLFSPFALLIKYVHLLPWVLFGVAVVLLIVLGLLNRFSGAQSDVAATVDAYLNTSPPAYRVLIDGKVYFVQAYEWNGADLHLLSGVNSDGVTFLSMRILNPQNVEVSRNR